MNIKDILKLKKGEPFRAEGEVVYTKNPREFTARKTGNPFYSQFILVKDDSCDKDDALPVAVTYHDEGSRVNNGDFVDVKGEVGEYEGQKQYKGKLIKSSRKNDNEKEVKEKMKVFNGNGNGKEGYWDKRFDWEQEKWKYDRAGMSRSNGVQFAKEWIKTLLENKVIELTGSEEANYIFWGYATDFSRYIFDGTKPEEDIEVNEKEERTEEGNIDFPFGDAEVKEEKKAKKKVASKS